MRNDLRTACVEDPDGVAAKQREADAFSTRSDRVTGGGERECECKKDAREVRIGKNFP